MCGRYRIKDTDVVDEHMARLFGIPKWAEKLSQARFNIAPSQDCPVIIMDDEGDVLPIPTMMRWGLVPFWEQSPKPGLAPINAKSEEVTGKPMFRQSVQKRRCLVPADGFYEWLRVGDKTKYPFDIHLKGGRPFVMAGIYERATAVRPATFALLTTAPNEFMRRIHDRMPAILDEDEARRWLQPGPMTQEEVNTIAQSHPSDDMEAAPISSLVNSPKNDGPELLAPVAFEWPAKPPPKPIQQELF